MADRLPSYAFIVALVLGLGAAYLLTAEVVSIFTF